MPQEVEFKNKYIVIGLIGVTQQKAETLMKTGSTHSLVHLEPGGEAFAVLILKTEEPGFS